MSFRYRRIQKRPVPMMGHARSGELRTPDVPPPPSVLFYDGANVDGVGNSTLLDLDPVSFWDNQGTAGAVGDAFQAAAPSQPTFRRNQIHGYAAVNYDGVDDTLQTAGVLPLTAQITTFACVFRANFNAGARSLFDGGPGGALSRNLVFYTSTAVGMFAGGILGSTAGVTPMDGLWHSLECVFAAGFSFFIFDGVGFGRPTGGQSQGGATLGSQGVTILQSFHDGDIAYASHSAGVNSVAWNTWANARYGGFPQA